MDNALRCLEKAAQHVIELDTTNIEHHTSIAVEGLGKNMTFVRRYRYNECYRLLHDCGLGHSAFELLRDDDRFKIVISKLEKHAESD